MSVPTRQDLKVDATLFPPRSNDKKEKEKVIVVYNINIPAAFNDAERSNAVALIQRLLEIDFVGWTSHIVYQVTASFMLRNTSTGMDKNWTGSFFAKGNSPAQLTPFKNYDSATFAPTVQHAIDHAEETLSRAGLMMDTVWVFDSLESIILNVQSKIHRAHPVIIKRGLIQTLRSRKQVSFFVPL
jgi:hypothetical protein